MRRRCDLWPIEDQRMFCQATVLSKDLAAHAAKGELHRIIGEIIIGKQRGERNLRTVVVGFAHRADVIIKEGLQRLFIGHPRRGSEAGFGEHLKHLRH